MRIFPLMILMLAMAILTGCTKKNEATPSTTPGPLAKLKSSVVPDYVNGGFLTTTYTYNTDGTIAVITHDGGAKDMFTYAAGIVTDTYYSSTGSVIHTYTYYLNADGRADSLTIASGGQTAHKKFTYNESGNLIMEISQDGNYIPSGVTHYTYEDGNQAGIFIFDGHNTLYRQDAFTYLTDRKNTIGNENYGEAFLGVQSKNIYGDDHVTNQGSSDFFYLYTYSYDSLGRVSTMHFHNTTGVDLGTTTYTYY